MLTGPDDTDPIAWTRDGRLIFQGSDPDGVYPLIGAFPVFLRDGRTLAFLRDRQLIALPWRDRDGRFEIGAERPVAPLVFGSGWMFGAPYDPAADGRFLALVRTEPPLPLRIRVVLGWDRELTRLGSRHLAPGAPAP